jgi:hypothetical protein
MSEAGNEAGRRPPAFQRWLGRRTLRGRLIAGLLALLAVACAAIGVVTYVGLRHGLTSQLDQQLTAASARYVGCLEAGPPDNAHGEGGSGSAQNPAGGQSGENDHDVDNVPGGPQNCGKQQGGETSTRARSSTRRWPMVTAA